ncbi:hypothetical protein [Sphingobacterium cellulitidis]|uniref:Tail fiber domain-containing protein n=1 Tax=Sphingobacterium cellulitidis TaxID=1768011 RepID=A0A8H9KXA3_9SPHI|nr:hypothetical protein [Sphingobacterium soli]MBA8986135.1 hypothetical protein [Sphingobacterium soli]GGE17900.1 hypothetical protein GCM10011516_14450 [Sphingobacterium soli]
MKFLYFVLLTGILFHHVIFLQTPFAASVNTSGWKRVAYVNSAAGRGFGKVTIIQPEVTFTPYQLDIAWFKDWANAAGISIKSNSSTGYWTGARIIYDADTALIEVNFTRDVAALSILSDTYGWNIAKPNKGILPDGGGTVRAETKVGKMAINDYLMVAFNGNVGIGTTSHTAKLAVNGLVRAKETKVEAAPWPDYVFDEQYKLVSLEEIRHYINQHGHLPEVPTAKEVAHQGIELGKMNALLLKKIEELTLHPLKKEEQLRDQSKAIEDLSIEIKI